MEGSPVTTSSHPPAATTDALDAITEDYPHWSTWRGIAGLVYARRRRSTPALVVRSISVAGLRVEIELALRKRGIDG